MRLSYIELAGFRGFRQRVRLEVPRGFLVVSGRNGTGKSTVIDAIEFVLTGTIDKYIAETGGRESVRDYLWWRGTGVAEDHYVSVGFVDDEGLQIDLVRSRDGGLSIEAEDLENLLCDQGLRPPQALQHMCRTSIIRDELIAALTWDQTDTARFEFVRSALGALAPKDLTVNLTEAISVAEGIRDQAQMNAELSAERLRSVLADLSEARATTGRAVDLDLALARLQEAVGPRHSVADLLAAARAHVADHRAAFESMAALSDEFRAIETLNEQVESHSFKAELQGALARLNAAKAAHDAADQRLRDAEARLELEESANTVAASLAALAEHGERVGLEEGHCPLCSASRTEEEFRRGIERLKTSVSSIAASLAEVRTQVGTRRQEEAVARLDLQNAQADYDLLGQLPNRLEQSRSAAMQKWGRFSTGPKLPSAREVERRVSGERERLADLERHVYVLEASQTIDRVARLEATAATAEAEVDRTGASASAAEAAIVRLREAERAVRRLNGEIVDERLASISPLLSELYYRLRPHRNWRSIDYMIRGDVRRFLSLRVGESLNPQFLFSSGERRAAGLAFLLAVSLSRPWCRWKTLALDDPVQHVDDFRALHLVELLSAIRKTNRQIICAAEDPELADLLCRRLRSTPNEPGARVELDSDPSGAHVASTNLISPLPASGLLSA